MLPYKFQFINKALPRFNNSWQVLVGQRHPQASARAEARKSLSLKVITTEIVLRSVSITAFWVGNGDREVMSVLHQHRSTLAGYLFPPVCGHAFVHLHCLFHEEPTVLLESCFYSIWTCWLEINEVPSTGLKPISCNSEVHIYFFSFPGKKKANPAPVPAGAALTPCLFPGSCLLAENTRELLKNHIVDKMYYADSDWHRQARVCC